MPERKGEALIDLTTEELKDALRQHSDREGFFYEDVYKELQRRTLNRLTTWGLALAALGALAAVVSAIAAIAALKH